MAVKAVPMRWLRALTVILAITATPAARADDAIDEASAYAALAAAIDVAGAHGEDRYAFTMTFTNLELDRPRPYVLRFDPRLPEGARWSLLEPAEETLTKDERKNLERLRRSDSADGALVYDGLAKVLGGARLVSQDAARAVFAAPMPDDSEAPKKAREALEMTLTLDRAGGHIETISLRAAKPFKPAAPAVVKALRQTQTFAAPAEGGPALLSVAESFVSGEAMFRAFSSHTRTEYSDIEKVDAPPRP